MKIITIRDISNMNLKESQDYLGFLLSQDFSEWFLYIKENTQIDEISTYNIPQFSNFEDATSRIVKLLLDNGNSGFSYERVGKYLLGKGKKALAYKKYGENHSKLSSMLGITKIEKEGRTNKVYVTDLGLLYSKLPYDKKDNFIKKEVLLIPIINELIYSKNYINIEELLGAFLSETTTLRRKPNVNYLFTLAREEYEKENNTLKEYIR